MSDSDDSSAEKALEAGRRLAQAERRARDLRQRAQQEDLLRNPLEEDDQRAAARLSDEDRRGSARLAEQEEQPEVGRRTTPMSFALRADLKERLNKFRTDGGTINVSGICNEAIERELDRIQSGNAVVQRLRVELTERRGPSWTAGYQTGRKWAEEIASWLEITEYATRYTSRDIKVKLYLEESPEEFVAFMGRFRAPERDYGRDTRGGAPAAPSFVKGRNTDGGPLWEYIPSELETFWRGWLLAVQEIYSELKDQLPSVEEELPTEQIPLPDGGRQVDPDEIPF
jgi:hypothetical protein